MSTNHKPTQIQYRNPAKEKTTDIQNVCKYRLGLGIDIHFTIWFNLYVDYKISGLVHYYVSLLRYKTLLVKFCSRIN